MFRFSLFKEYDAWGKFYLFIATFATSGLLKPAPGTWGSLAAAVVSWLLYAYTQPAWWNNQFLWTLGLFFLGWFASYQLKKRDGRVDPGYIVIDEAAGIFMVNFALFSFVGNDPYWLQASWLLSLFGFVLFRVFDICKPGVIGWFDRKFKTTFALMFDDILAGFAAAFTGVVILFALRFFGWDLALLQALQLI
ncbi:phosphatidylglycerophosphatase A family protein [Psittacicella gerlachiana]|nr:phosphatidylglycerophosphatase A [Psittacicella gerlachiana]